MRPFPYTSWGVGRGELSRGPACTRRACLPFTPCECPGSAAITRTPLLTQAPLCFPDSVPPPACTSGFRPMVERCQDDDKTEEDGRGESSGVFKVTRRSPPYDYLKIIVQIGTKRHLLKECTSMVRDVDKMVRLGLRHCFSLPRGELSNEQVLQVMRDVAQYRLNYFPVGIRKDELAFDSLLDFTHAHFGFLMRMCENLEVHMNGILCGSRIELRCPARFIDIVQEKVDRMKAELGTKEVEKEADHRKNVSSIRH